MTSLLLDQGLNGKYKESKVVLCISPQALREHNARNLHWRGNQHLSRTTKVTGAQKSFGPSVRGAERYCAYRDRRHTRSSNVLIGLGRPCQCQQSHSRVHPRDWRDTPAEANWDYSLPNGGNIERTRKVKFADEKENQVFEVPRWDKRAKLEQVRHPTSVFSSIMGCSANYVWLDTEHEDDEADEICQQYEDYYGDLLSAYLGLDTEAEFSDELRSSVSSDTVCVGHNVDDEGTLDPFLVK